MRKSEELRLLAERKALLQARIAARRDQIARAAEELARPVSMAVQGVDLWRAVPALVKTASVPLAVNIAKRVGLFLLRR